MPLGNLTSQFFANVYLNELDNYVKHNLGAKYYIRYVDDFVIINSNKSILEKNKEDINQFLKQKLKIELHPSKSKIIPLGNRLTFLGFRIFCYHILLKKSNLRKMKINFGILKKDYKEKRIDCDILYDFLEGWFAYAQNANNHKLRKKIASEFEKEFPNELSTKEVRMAKELCKLL